MVTTVTSVVVETPRAATLVLDVPDWPGHRPGQHLDVRLTAEDGYQAQRSYSVASAPGEPVAITVERIDDGEVSPYLTTVARPGDQLEVRGPIGGHFVWDGDTPAPVLLVGGGSGVVPLMAMIRHRRALRLTTPLRLLYSARRLEDLLYVTELEELRRRPDGPDVRFTVTRDPDAAVATYHRRVDEAMIADAMWPDPAAMAAFVCGPTGFVEVASRHLVDSGVPAHRVKTERFGPSGT